MNSDGFGIVDIVIFAMIAGFIILRLRSVLGRRTGNERPPPGDPRSGPANGRAGGGEPLSFPGGEPVSGEPADPLHQFDADPAVREGLRLVCRADSRFDPQAFLDGAKSAFDMILTAFWDGNLADVQDYLGPAVRGGFETAIEARNQNGQQLENRILEITKSEIAGAGINGRIAEISVRFEADIIAVTRDAEGRVIEGNESDSIEIAYIWTFSRETKSRDPNWILVKTRAA